MSVVLITAWEPRGEFKRLLRFRPRLSDLYTDIIIAAPDRADAGEVAALNAEPGVRVVTTTEGAWRRYVALVEGLKTEATYFHYLDTDRAAHWVETRPAELAQAVSRVQTTDCLLLGRTEAAWATHPQAMRQTEAIFNHLFSRLLGVEADFGAGARGFSRRAAEYLLARVSPDHWSDTAWPVVLWRGGFRLDTLLADGLDWETPDQYRDAAADPDAQRHIAAAYDADPANWSMRVWVADEITKAGLAAWLAENRELI